jgi:TonB family protein
MTPIEKIKFSYPCREDINKMSPCSLGKHCSSCNRTVIDFRNRNLAELSKSIEEKGTVCGIFSESQIEKPAYSSKLKRLVASILIAIGMGVFNKDLYAQTIKSDSLTENQSSTEKLEYFLGTIEEIPAIYKNGGEIGLLDFIHKNINYPSDSIQGKVIASFTVDTLGKVKDAKIEKGLNESIDKEVLRVIELLEFMPGTQFGKKIEMKYILPINFIIDNNRKK